MTPRQIAARRAALARASGAPVHVISGVAGQGVPEVLRALADAVARARRRGRTRHDALARRRPPARREDRQRAGGGCRRGGAAHRVARRHCRGHCGFACAGRGRDRGLLRRDRARAPRAGLRQRRLRLEEKQAAAAVGQIRLAQAWSEALSAHGLTAAQLLLTLDDTEDRRRYLNARATLTTLLGLGCVPVINENDSIATAEIRVGDNDRLAARVAEMVQADQLVLLSDIDGLYSADPKRDPDAVHLPVIETIDAGDRGDGRRSAAGLFLRRHAHEAGRGTHRHRRRLRHGDRARRHRRIRCARWSRARAAPGSCPPRKDVRRASGGFSARCSPSARSRWMPVRRGRWRAGSSLLPAGVRTLSGRFERGDAVEVRGPDGTLLGARAFRLCERRCRAHHRASQRGDRGDPRLARAR